MSSEPLPSPVPATPAAMQVDHPEIPLADAPVGGRPEDPLPTAARFFRVLNRYLMVPATRSGLGAWMSTPIGGAMVLLRIRGRKSGQIRETPLNYVVAEGALWVLAGFGPRTEWYRNLQSDAAVEAVLPGRTIHGRATDVRDPAVRRRIMPAILRSTLGPSAAAGLNPFAAPDDIAEEMGFVPLLRIDPDEGWLEPEADDPGGLAWVWRQALVAAVSIAAIIAMRRVVGGVRRTLG
jgi:deazaflavin-dependent oxidoreductase (nitroreductase family)